MIDDDELYGLHCDIGRLEQENAKLRTQLADVTESMGRVEERCAKLRGMVSALRQCLEWKSCKGCSMQDDAGWCVRDVRLHDMGIEVDA